MESHQRPVPSCPRPEICGRVLRAVILEYDVTQGCGYLYLTGRLDPAHFPSRRVLFKTKALRPQPRDDRDFCNNFRGKPVHCILDSEESGQQLCARTIQLLPTETTRERASEISSDSAGSSNVDLFVSELDFDDTLSVDLLSHVLDNLEYAEGSTNQDLWNLQALDMGFSWFLITEAISCTTFETFESFVDTLMALQEANNCGDSDASEQPRAVDMEKLRDLRRENFALKNHLTCKMCMENELEVMVFPCGHMVFCVACSWTFQGQPERICPVCRESVTLLFIKENEPVREITIKVDETATPEETDALEEQNRILRSHRLCDRCGQRDRSQYFVPCNHVLLCEECTRNTKSCPACDSHITQKVAIFVS